MFNMNNKNRRLISTIIILALVIAMVGGVLAAALL